MTSRLHLGPRSMGLMSQPPAFRVTRMPHLTTAGSHGRVLMAVRATAQPPSGKPGQTPKRSSKPQQRKTSANSPQSSPAVPPATTNTGSQTNVNSYQVVNQGAQDVVVAAADVAMDITDATANTAGTAATDVASAAQSAAAATRQASAEASSAVRSVADEVADAVADTADAAAAVATDTANALTEVAAEAADQFTADTAGAVGTVVGGVTAAAQAVTDNINGMVFAEASMNGNPRDGNGYTTSASPRPSGNSSTGSGSSSRPGSSLGGGRYSPPSMDPCLKTVEMDEEEAAALQLELLAAVSSLDRGLAANLREARQVDQLASKLEALAGPVTLDWKTSRSRPDASSMDLLAGTWRLIYSSGFNNGSLGGSRPGPPAAFVPLVLGQVYQIIDAQQGRLDNVVELLASFGLPRLPFLSNSGPEPTPGIRVTLGHSCSMSSAADVRIVYDSTAVQPFGPELVQRLPQLQVPELPEFLRPPANFRAATFTVVYLDDTMRITRGDRGELRIYLRDEDLVQVAPGDYVD